LKKKAKNVNFYCIFCQNQAGGGGAKKGQKPVFLKKKKAKKLVPEFSGSRKTELDLSSAR